MQIVLELVEVEAEVAPRRLRASSSRHRRLPDWSAATGYSLEEVRTPGNDYWVASPPGGGWPRMVFVTVPERKVVKNRVHLDLMPVERDQDEEVNRLLGL